MKRSKEIAAYAAAFTGPLAGNAVLALLGTLQEEWAVSPTTLLLAIPAFMFPFAVIQLFSGTISDAYDRRATVGIGLAVYALGSFACAASPSFGFFMATRFLQGIGYAFVSPVLVAMISDVAGGSRQGLAMGYFGSSTTAGVAAGPLLAGVLAEVEWRLTFVAIGLLAMAVLASIMVLYERDGKARRMISAGTVLKQLMSALGDWKVMSVSFAGFMAFFSFIGVISFVSDYLSSGPIEGGPSEIGAALAVSGLMGIVLSPVAGRMVDTRGARCCVTVGFCVFASSTALFVFADSYWHVVALLAVNGIGTSFVWASLLVMIVRSLPSLKGTSSSVFNSLRFLGYAFSPILLSPLYVTSGFTAIMVACATIGIIGLALALSSGSHRRG